MHTLTPDQDSEKSSEERELGRKRARKKAMDYLARRDHSELELRTKLKKFFTEEQVSFAVSHCRTHGWLKSPAELAEAVARGLAQKKKSHRYIQQYLAAKGLPAVARDRDSEFSKAQRIIESKMRTAKPQAKEILQQRLIRQLQNRGFDLEVILSAMKSTVHS